MINMMLPIFKTIEVQIVKSEILDQNKSLISEHGEKDTIKRVSDRMFLKTDVLKFDNAMCYVSGNFLMIQRNVSSDNPSSASVEVKPFNLNDVISYRCYEDKSGIK